MNRENLKTLSDGLLGLIPAIDDINNIRFDMESYSEINKNNYLYDMPNPEIKMKTCGSVGCAIGWAPYFGIEKHLNENWTDFSERVFKLDNNSQEWDYLFSSDWSDIDNTKRGAGLRIKYVLEHGLPANAFDQLHYAAELSYEAG